MGDNKKQTPPPVDNTISEETGQSDRSTRRRLQEMKKSGRFKELKVITRNGLGLTRALYHLRMRKRLAHMRTCRAP